MRLEPQHPPTSTSNMNVGDDLNFYIFPEILGDLLDNSSDSAEVFLGIGSLLTKKRFKKLEDAKQIVIFSSGAWDSNWPTLTDSCNVLGVRGYRTAEKLGLPQSKAIGDGAYLLSSFEYPKAKCKGKIGFIPHQSSERYVDWKNICDEVGLTFITPKQPANDFFIQLQECKYVVTEAMHGAIIADALRIPWVPVRFAPDFCAEKWYDFAEYMDLNISIKKLTFINEKDIPIAKSIENLFRKISANLFDLSDKKKNAPLTFFKSSPDKRAKLCLELTHCVTTYLSSDEKLRETVKKQQEILEQFIKDKKQ